MKFLVINGPNLNLLGKREPHIYGIQDYAALIAYLETAADENGVRIKIKQSNHEGTIIDEIQAAMGHYDGIVINPAGYTHTSVAIMDAIKAVEIPTVEVHLTNIDDRESFRHVSYPGMACIKTFMGKGFNSYGEAIEYLKDYIEHHS